MIIKKEVMYSFFIILAIQSCKEVNINSTGDLIIKYDSIRVNDTNLARYYNYDIYEYSSDSIMLFAYNYINHSIDRFNLTSHQILEPIKLNEEGPNSVSRIVALRVTKYGIIVDSSLGISVLTTNGVITAPYQTKILNQSFLNEKYQFKKSVFINRFGTLGVSPDGKKVVMPAYSLSYLYESTANVYKKSHVIGVFNLDNGRIAMFLPKNPEYFSGRIFFGDLDDLLVKYDNEDLLYSYRCTPIIYKYNPNTSETKYAKNIPEYLLKSPKSIKKDAYLGNKRKSYLANSTSFFEIRYDKSSAKYFRPYKKETSSNLIHDYSNNYLMQFDQDLSYETSYELDEEIIPDVFPTSKGLFALCSAKDEEYLRIVLIEPTVRK